MLQVKADKLREVKNGHDGTWVAHPALVTLALEIFNEHMPQPNQIDKKREDVHVTRENLLEVLTDNLYTLLSRLKSCVEVGNGCVHLSDPARLAAADCGCTYLAGT